MVTRCICVINHLFSIVAPMHYIIVMCPRRLGLYTGNIPRGRDMIYFRSLCGCLVTNDITTQHDVKRVN